MGPVKPRLSQKPLVLPVIRIRGKFGNKCDGGNEKKIKCAAHQVHPLSAKRLGWDLSSHGFAKSRWN